MILPPIKQDRKSPLVTSLPCIFWQPPSCAICAKLHFQAFWDSRCFAGSLLGEGCPGEHSKRLLAIRGSAEPCAGSGGCSELCLGIAGLPRGVCGESLSALCVLLTPRRNLSCCRYALVRREVLAVLNVPSCHALRPALSRASLHGLRSCRTGLEVRVRATACKPLCAEAFGAPQPGSNGHAWHPGDRKS